MKKKFWYSLLAFAGVILLFSGTLVSPPADTHITVGIISPHKNLELVALGFKQELTSRAAEDGINIKFLYSGPLKNREQLEPTLTDMLAKGVDLLFTSGTFTTQKVRELTEGTGIPIVFAPVLYPVESGLVNSIARPGGRLTGVKMGSGTEKALEWLKTLAPDTRSVFVPLSSNDAAARQSLADLRSAADKLDLALLVAEFSSAEQLSTLIETPPAAADSFWLLHSPFTLQFIDPLVEAAKRARIPLGSSTSQYARGLLFSYGQDQMNTGKQAARLAYLILKGTDPASLPVENVEYSLGLNLQTAAEIGLNIPAPLIKQADFVIR